MSIRVRYFASLREALGRDEESIDLPAEISTAGDLRRWLVARGGVWAEQFADTRPVRIAVGQRMVNSDAPLAGASEIAFFPPVTGG